MQKLSQSNIRKNSGIFVFVTNKNKQKRKKIVLPHRKAVNCFIFIMLLPIFCFFYFAVLWFDQNPIEQKTNYIKKYKIQLKRRTITFNKNMLFLLARLIFDVHTEQNENENHRQYNFYQTIHTTYLTSQPEQSKQQHKNRNIATVCCVYYSINLSFTV